MAFPTWYEWLNAGVNVGNAVRTFNDPNVSALESVSAVINATSAFLTATGQLMPGAGGATAVTGLVVSKENIEVSLALLAESYSNVQQNSTPEAINSLVQNFGGTISAVGGAMYATGVVTENSSLFSWGLLIETYGNLIKEGNKWSAEHPTDFLARFFMPWRASRASLKTLKLRGGVTGLE